MKCQRFGCEEEAHPAIGEFCTKQHEEDWENAEAIKQLRSALENLAQQADEDCPAIHRSGHFRVALQEAYELLEKY